MFLRAIKPFIFRKSLDYKVIEDLKDIKLVVSGAGAAALPV